MDCSFSSRTTVPRCFSAAGARYPARDLAGACGGGRAGRGCEYGGRAAFVCVCLPRHRHSGGQRRRTLYRRRMLRPRTARLVRPCRAAGRRASAPDADAPGPAVCGAAVGRAGTSGRGQLVFGGAGAASHRRSTAKTAGIRGRPLAVVKTSLSAMQASPADTSQYLAAIGSEADRMARLVDDLLLLAGSDAGTWRMRMEPVDVDALVIGAHEQFAPLVKARGLRLALDLPEETLPPLWGDAGRLRQLLLVFISNACAYAPAGSDVTLRARAEKGWVLLSVEDHGPGIPPEELPHLFDRYYRARQDAGKTGTGLGLSITKAILQQHDFPFGVNSTVGKGSTFWFEMKAPQ